MSRHISISHNERYFHLTKTVVRTIKKQNKTTGKMEAREVNETVGYATVFFRQELPRINVTEDTRGSSWFVSVALCDPRDHFVRRTGRAVARRKYFAGKSIRCWELPSYDIAVMYANAALEERSAMKRRA